jgi:hypothetical protein
MAFITYQPEDQIPPGDRVEDCDNIIKHKKIAQKEGIVKSSEINQ